MRCALLVSAMWLIQSAVHPLVVQGTRHRRELVAKLARGSRHRVRLDRLGVLPDLDHGEMILPVDLLDDLEAQIALAAAALIAQALERGDAVVLARGDDVDVGRDVDTTADGRRVDRADGQPGVHPLIGRRVADGRDLLARVDRVGALAVRLERRLVLPDLEDRELMRLVDALNDLAAEIAAFLGGGVAVAPEYSRRLRLRRRHDLDVGHGVDVAHDRYWCWRLGRRRRLGPRVSDRADRHHDQPEEENTKERLHGFTPSHATLCARSAEELCHRATSLAESTWKWCAVAPGGRFCFCTGRRPSIRGPHSWKCSAVTPSSSRPRIRASGDRRARRTSKPSMTSFISISSSSSRCLTRR